jgi:hypothetical protein
MFPFFSNFGNGGGAGLITAYLDRAFCATKNGSKRKKKRDLLVTNRMTRFGEFSPIGWLFTLGTFLQITKVFGYFLKGLGHAFVSAKHGLGSILGDFFANSSGHPVYHSETSQFRKMLTHPSHGKKD